METLEEKRIMEKTMKFIDSKDNYWDKGMNLGIAMIVISLLGQIKSPWFELKFDWMLILFLGLGVFFFFMAIRLNTWIDTNINENENPETKQRHRQTFTSYQTFLDRFSNLSKASFTISTIFGIISAIRLIFLIYK